MVALAEVSVVDEIFCQPTVILSLGRKLVSHDPRAHVYHRDYQYLRLVYQPPGLSSTYQDCPMYLIRAVTVHSNRPKEVWFGPSAYTARILWSGGEIFLLRALGDHLWGHSGALWAPRRAACAERRRRQLPKPLPVSATVCWRSGSLGQGQ